MLEKFRTLYEEKLTVKLITVFLVVLASLAILIPIVQLALLFGVDLMNNNGVRMKVDFGNVFFFFLFGASSIGIIWLAQKYLHKRTLADLGFRTKILTLFFIGFLVGVLMVGLEYLVLGMSASEVKFVSVIPSNSSIPVYIGYYIYFFFGMLIWNSLIEELGCRAYPIEALRKHLNPHIIFTLMGVLFTLGHFVVRDFDISYAISLFITSYALSGIYYYSGSIWLVIGVHTGMNWFGFSFGGNVDNWKLGALVRIEIQDIPTWIFYTTGPLIGIGVFLLVRVAHKKGLFKKNL
ncbi:CPBP family intramembrane glutamic endopeptidase [Fluviicola taffensis]|uniref:Abortive infection protein n=1 Tax=Fluviicola taffensis (strain DSM 16823 / NCIMB 13979 / RW262) TaxID=755732 RepID=F2I970_FLUTR|nr:CPBP family intramembrane glutamic endopeptidase [Fluviicola taffensis]AEA43017.1 Abortive infection protein [Fluviicola taffensis DSM 16823]